VAKRTINQHFVPQFYLRNFSANGDGKTIWVLNKEAHSIFPSPITDAGSENNFFIDPTVEPRITKFENIVLPAYKNVLQRFGDGELELLDTKEISGLSLLVTLQWWRTKLFRMELDHNLKSARQTIADNLRTVEKMDPDAVDNLLNQHFPKQRIDAFQAEMIFNYDSIQLAANKLMQEFNWTMAISRLDSVLITSDNPVSMKTRHLGQHGNEIVFPLSDKLLLVLTHTEAKNKSGMVLLPQEITKVLNYNQYHSCNQFAYSSDKQVLSAFL
jgi:hypothetical protein